MTPDELAVLNTVERLIDAVLRHDVRVYREMVEDDVSSFVTDITPYRIDCLDFHLHLLEQRSQSEKSIVHPQILTPRVQLYGDFAVASYTLLLTVTDSDGTDFETSNETRVFIKRDDSWKMVHIHRSSTD